MGGKNEIIAPQSICNNETKDKAEHYAVKIWLAEIPAIRIALNAILYHCSKF